MAPFKFFKINYLRRNPGQQILGLIFSMPLWNRNHGCPMRFLLVLACLFFMASALAGLPAEIEFAASTPYNDKPVMLRAELYQPDGDGPYPAVILMHGCGGLQPPVRDAMRTHAEYLVGHGFVALVLDSFGPRENGDGWVCKTFDRLMAARRYRKNDALDALKYLQSLAIVDDTNLFQMGQSNGGSVAIRLAQLDAPAFRARSAYYP
jgi:acetyl esterase/lipase